ncbi:hypothetical protein COURTHOUSE_130 [Mycobacterium phage Courthouse]|uniref:Uncharacterized protein n=2 Tax=Omegavirus courthouse TaxID=1089119 RepID=G8I5I7_9CAUD|nr:hypothetical protein CM09_gp130 [Mycobacterium phage Courthouse]YP_009205264.1 hypothetical protein AVT17_gp134 [Mycobacterium phage Ariel]YP_009213351.1 hypothetical protein AVV70_gp134 [Mycobacterium phage MiaZeal]ASD50754.1 hypothetical protein PORCELAIN_132 [Mycobacterium phage Porcelain]ATS92973.1 hypothetical protein SEA_SUPERPHIKIMAN_132 [Mycobacterium phage Superphikiman]AER47981.1 hypothetical protein COURTHOUSE_130 [Mycobacterium phage Courthouse]AIM50011.1 hypothetical protein P
MKKLYRRVTAYLWYLYWRITGR